MVPHNSVTTAFDLPGFRVKRNLGVVCGVVVRSRSSVGGFAGLQTNLCEKTREDAFELMLQRASQMGANAVICPPSNATEITNGVSEVVAYGTAVEVEPAG